MEGISRAAEKRKIREEEEGESYYTSTSRKGRAEDYYTATSPLRSPPRRIPTTSSSRMPKKGNKLERKRLRAEFLLENPGVSKDDLKKPRKKRKLVVAKIIYNKKDGVMELDVPETLQAEGNSIFEGFRNRIKKTAFFKPKKQLKPSEIKEVWGEAMTLGRVKKQFRASRKAVNRKNIENNHPKMYERIKKMEDIKEEYGPLGSQAVKDKLISEGLVSAKLWTGGVNKGKRTPEGNYKRGLVKRIESNKSQADIKSHKRMKLPGVRTVLGGHTQSKINRKQRKSDYDDVTQSYRYDDEENCHNYM